MARPTTRRERDTINTAYHEAGHAVIAVALGMPVSSIWLTGERAAVGRLVGRVQLDAAWRIESPPDPRDLWLHSLAGDAVDRRRVHVPTTGPAA
jgi:hypothetical protein